MHLFRLSSLLLIFTSASFAQFTYAPVNVPGADATVARGINSSGEVAGFYQTVSCSNYDKNVPDCPTKGFKLVNNTYIKLMVPGSTATAINGVNDSGDLVGFYTKSDGTKHGFIWYHQNVVKTIDYPNTTYTTVPMGIDRAGTVVGGLWSISATGTFAAGGWVWVNGTFSNMDPGGSNNGTCCQSVNGISNNGILAGQVFYHDFWNAWLKESSDDDFWTYQGADTYGTGINSNTDVVGYSGASGWFAQDVEANEGNADSEGTIKFFVVQYPGSQSTSPFGVNDSRYVVGAYTDSQDKQHGFIAQSTF